MAAIPTHFLFHRSCLLLALLAWTAFAQLKGQVVDATESPIEGALVHWREANLDATTDSQGKFEFQALAIRPGKFQGSPGQNRLEFAAKFILGPNGLQFNLGLPQPLKISIFSLRGRNYVTGNPLWSTAVTGHIPLPQGSATWILRCETKSQIQWLRVHRIGATGQVMALDQNELPTALKKETASSRQASFPSRMTLETSAQGFASRQLAFEAGDSAHIALLPSSASLKQRIHWMMGDSLQLRMAWLEFDSEKSMILNWATLDELDSTVGANGNQVTTAHWKAKTFIDSKGATLPSWSPDGDWIAYETGREAATIPTSQVYLQPLNAARITGPAYPATNPRFAILPNAAGNGSDTLLTWCTSGKGSAWTDTASKTLGLKWKDGATAGEILTLAKGSFNAGFSGDGLYVAASYPRGIVMKRTSGELHSMHVYPKASGGNDSLQICNASISQNPLHPDRMLFIDFGVFTEPGYPNRVRPVTYAQHQMLLLADYSSEQPGSIVDFLDTPSEALAQDKSWEDPEWSTHSDYAIATTRLDAGDAITQPDVYLIRLSTHEVVKLFSGENFFMPIAWVHR